MPQTIIVSNRLPVSVRKNNGRLEYYPSSGGLATGMASFTEKKSNLWIGWPGIPSDELTEAERQQVTDELSRHHCYPIFLSQRQLDEYYNGYSNSVLWPFLHDLPLDKKELKRVDAYWKAYRQVNQRFARVVGTLADSNARLWIHDYQLLLLPAMLRRANSRATIGFFMHVPWPAAPATAALPAGKKIAKGLLGADLIGFHTKLYAQNFLEAAQTLSAGIVVADKIITKNNTSQVTAFPLGIDYDKFSQANNLAAVRKATARLKKRYGNRKIILTVDRLDPSKGFIERLNAYRQFLATHPKWRRKVVLVMLAVPSRGEIKAYRVLRQQVEELVTTINQLYGTHSWKPVDYIYNSLPFERVSALYQMADVAFVSPLRDGMNLVAKEYIASKSGRSGVLILSRTAGAAAELKDALLVNPTEPKELAMALADALLMPKRELQARLNRMQAYLSANTVQTWSASFMKTLQQSSNYRPSLTKPLRGVAQKRLVNKFNSASKRLILLDYDGVLTGFKDRPSDARPSAATRKLLTKLARQPNTKVVIISGRSEADMDKWLGDLPVDLAAEHGVSIKTSGGDWNPIVKSPAGWKRIVRPVLDKYASLAPGAFVEDKKYSLVWHYRRTPPYYAQKYIVILKRALAPTLKHYGLKLYHGNKIIEIKPPDVSKASATKFFLIGNYDFTMAIGDDLTDEDIFKALPRGAVSIKVGRGNSRAGRRLSGPKAVHQLLEKLAS